MGTIGELKHHDIVSLSDYEIFNHDQYGVAVKQAAAACSVYLCLPLNQTPNVPVCSPSPPTPFHCTCNSGRCADMAVGSRVLSHRVTRNSVTCTDFSVLRTLDNVVNRHVDNDPRSINAAVRLTLAEIIMYTVVLAHLKGFY